MKYGAVGGLNMIDDVAYERIDGEYRYYHLSIFSGPGDRSLRGGGL